MESWENVRLFTDGDEYFNSMIEDIDSARDSVAIESYIFAYDRLTQRVLESLAKAKARDCQVHLLVDGFGSYTSIAFLKIFCRNTHIFFSVFHPVPFLIILLQKFLVRMFSKSERFFDRMNSRNHRKVAIIDNSIAYLGSLNFVEYHCRSYVQEKAWRDTGVRVQGPQVAILTRAFNITFIRTLSKDFLERMGRWKLTQPPPHEGINLNTTQKMRKLWYRRLIRNILRAEKCVYITTAYFLPRRSLTRALTFAKKKGVDVRIIIPGKSDTHVVRWAGQSLIEYLSKKNVKIYEYQPTILHAKTMIIDDSAYVGSFNFNHRSLLHDLEVELIFKDTAVVSEMKAIWQNDLSNSALLTPEILKQQQSPFKRLLYKAAFRMRYML